MATSIRSGTFKVPPGEAIAYDLYLPIGAGPFAAVLLCQGLSGVKNLVLPDVGDRLAAAGLAALAFDYRGFGASEGARGWVDPFSRLEDARHAFDFLRAQPEVTGQPGIYTLSLGGLMGYALACERQDVACLNVSSGPASGERVMRGLRTADDYLALKKRLHEEPEAMVPLGDLFPFPGAFQHSYDALKQGSPAPHSSSIPPGQTLFHLVSASQMIAFNYLPQLSQIAPVPVLVQHGSDDNVLPVEDAIEVYRALDTPKEMVIHDGYDHVGLDSGPGFELQVARAIEFFTAHMLQRRP